MKRGDFMKKTIHTKNIFKSENADIMKKVVTEKMEKLLNLQIRKTT